MCQRWSPSFHAEIKHFEFVLQVSPRLPLNWVEKGRRCRRPHTLTHKWKSERCLVYLHCCCVFSIKKRPCPTGQECCDRTPKRTIFFPQDTFSSSSLLGAKPHPFLFSLSFKNTWVTKQTCSSCQLQCSEQNSRSYVFSLVGESLCNVCVFTLVSESELSPQEGVSMLTWVSELASELASGADYCCFTCDGNSCIWSVELKEPRLLWVANR